MGSKEQQQQQSNAYPQGLHRRESDVQKGELSQSLLDAILELWTLVSGKKTHW